MSHESFAQELATVRSRGDQVRLRAREAVEGEALLPEALEKLRVTEEQVQVQNEQLPELLPQSSPVPATIPGGEEKTPPGCGSVLMLGQLMPASRRGDARSGGVTAAATLVRLRKLSAGHPPFLESAAPSDVTMLLSGALVMGAWRVVGLVSRCLIRFAFCRARVREEVGVER